MGIGDGFNNSNNNGNQQGNNKLYDSTFYSRLRFRGKDNSISISYRSGLMCLELYTVEATTYKVNPIGNVWLSPIKASMLATEIKKFKEYLQNDKIDEKVAFGVNAGMGEKVSYIGFHTNKDKDVIITIGKFDDNGQIIISEKLDRLNRLFMNITPEMTIELTSGNKKYLTYHRENVFNAS